jgi:hypothetical protein
MSNLYSDYPVTSKICRERWQNHLNPSINRDSWTSEEDVFLIETFLIYGGKWGAISRGLRGRTENHVKNRFHSLKRRAQRLTRCYKIKKGSILELMLAAVSAKMEDSVNTTSALPQQFENPFDMKINDFALLVRDFPEKPFATSQDEFRMLVSPQAETSDTFLESDEMELWLNCKSTSTTPLSLNS